MIIFFLIAGYSERVSLGFSFVLSVFLVIGSLTITVAIVAYYYYCCKSQGKSYSTRKASPDPPDKHRFEMKEAP